MMMIMVEFEEPDFFQGEEGVRDSLALPLFYKETAKMMIMVAWVGRGERERERRGLHLF